MPMLVVEHGTEMFICKFFSTIYKIYGITRQYDQKKLNARVNKFGAYTSKDGLFRVRRVIWKDYKPRKGEVRYEKSIVQESYKMIMKRQQQQIK